MIEADTAGDELIDALVDLAAAGRGGAVIPCVDETVLLLARDRDRIEPAHELPFGDLGWLETLSDKARFAMWAETNGVPVPRTAVLETVADAEVAARALSFPCALKPAARTERWLAAVDVKGFKLQTPDALISTYRRVAAFADRLVAQEWVPGPAENLHVLRGFFDRDGKPLATFSARLIRQWPPDTGIAVSLAECRSEAAERIALDMLERIGHYGFAMVEVKRDERTGEHLVIEANVGRPTALSGHAERTGVELLRTAYCEMLGLPLPNARRQRDLGTKYVFLRGDIRAALSLGRRRLTLRGWVSSLRGRRGYALLSGRDPLPFLVDLARAGSALLRRA